MSQYNPTEFVFNVESDLQGYEEFTVATKKNPDGEQSIDIFYQVCENNGDYYGAGPISMAIPAPSIDKFHSYLQNRFTMSNSHKVKQFTEESTGNKLEGEPTMMSLKNFTFLIEMVQSELVEAAMVYTNNPKEAVELVKSCVGKKDTKEIYQKPTDKITAIAEVTDAFVDAYYYMQNALCKENINMSRVFDIVHGANMNKKFPDGKFHRRADGKVIKPEAIQKSNGEYECANCSNVTTKISDKCEKCKMVFWRPPNVVQEIENQIKHGAW